MPRSGIEKRSGYGYIGRRLTGGAGEPALSTRPNYTRVHFSDLGDGMGWERYGRYVWDQRGVCWCPNHNPMIEDVCVGSLCDE